MNRPSNRFRKGSGCFECINCTRLTRDTGGDNTSLDFKLCAECYELAGLENDIADNGETPAKLADVERLKALILSKGGKV